MKIKKDLKWDSSKLEWRGVVDNGEGITKKTTNDFADHALVFMFRPYKENWVQPIACFASRGAASGEMLHELIIQAMCMVHNHN